MREGRDTGGCKGGEGTLVGVREGRGTSGCEGGEGHRWV